LAFADPSGHTVDFDRDLRAILSDTCYKCHGPDPAQRKAKLRLDTRAGAFADGDVIVAGDPAASELFQRITAADAADRMPPVDSGRTLTKLQIEKIRKWIEEGAQWREHWSFVSPKRQSVPPTHRSEWARNPIDDFILARLEREGLEPSPEADRTALIRRVTLDLTGLPPTPAEVDAYLADTSSEAYEKVVDRLLDSTRYGERMAMEWLDVARYADTSGYQTDGIRYMWRWRDWVIEAFNRNLPYDQFTIEQLAGDLLPDPSLDQLIATGFNRNHRASSEGGIVEEEFLAEYAVDRVETTATVWLGLTLGCARCHSHKYDPFTQKEFYQLFAFFDNLAERGRVFKYGNSDPLIKAPTPLMQSEMESLDRSLAATRRELEDLGDRLAASQSAWEASLSSSKPASNTEIDGPSDVSVPDGLRVHYQLDGDTNDSGTDSRVCQFRGESGHSYTAGVFGQGVSLDGSCFLEAAKAAPVEHYDRVSVGSWIYPSSDTGGVAVAFMNDEGGLDGGLSLYLQDGRFHLDFGQRWLDDALRVRTLQRLEPARWHHLMMTYDGSQRPAGMKLYVNGELQEVEALLDQFTGNFDKVLNILRIGSHGGETHFTGAIDDVRYYGRELEANEVQIIANADSIAKIAALPPDKRTAEQTLKIDAYFLRRQAPERIRRVHRRLRNLRQQRQELEDRIPTTMVMRDQETPRDTFLLIRGQYDKPGEQVFPGIPAALSSNAPVKPSNRLDLARWLVSPDNPLTSRVAVNRYWQMYFGTGLVKTTEDFGSQGERPSHPELLDWLATEFPRSDWDVKALQRLIVTSATYRQSARVSGELLQRDPDNRLLARAPRLRLPAEFIRDQALFVSGLLASTIGGPSVKPYQPAGLWKEIASQTYEQGTGQDLYRRSMYTYWKRTVPPPTMSTFDASSRETCVVNRARTNTPLQALALLNDVTYVEAARSLAERMITEGGATPRERIALGFRCVTARRPTAGEEKILLANLGRNESKYRDDREAATKLISVGESKARGDLDPGELAAYTSVASLLLNLDESITKE
jgi:hypothetical protein